MITTLNIAKKAFKLSFITSLISYFYLPCAIAVNKISPRVVKSTEAAVFRAIPFETDKAVDL
jgi:hypothetical protein